MLLSKIKKFVTDHEEEITIATVLVGGVMLGVSVTYLLCGTVKPKTITKIVPVTPEWVKNFADKWIDHCDVNYLVLKTGLPMFANEDHTEIFRDAISKEADVEELISIGFKVIDRQ